jgi:hypothetical protein
LEAANREALSANLRIFPAAQFLFFSNRPARSYNPAIFKGATNSSTLHDGFISEDRGSNATEEDGR